MTVSISNTTQETCAICHEDYQGKEISDVTKIVELACHHFYHIGCIAQSLRYQENEQRDLACCYCNQKVALSARAANIFANQEIFQERLEEIREDYNYDGEVVEAISVLSSLYISLHDLSNSFKVEGEGRRPDFSQAIGDLIIKNVEIKENLKATVLHILAAMLTGDQALRSVDGEAKRWRNIPFENWPDKIKQKGVKAS
ncbi:hypothetical protein [Candidatus Rhabdochlamydia porcellionis]|jgi:hypothetical protein|uniref:RING-type domain-containing protein n=1 Tax=Candidatus Rhabdochlamydia porcellionis TaxID=225148 RepID=A0ABX8Z126_9BACT|nr:hypothetical protein [Candidatus Rhabdochlamydia porcellionis]QZA59385.1 hypothetical protein RHAB15C_0001271 [Candidatus Rhabdochlamydia porcellionis]